MKLYRVYLAVICGAILAACVLIARATPHDNDWLVPEDARIAREIAENSEAMTNLEYLSDRIGPRVTGSLQMQRASEWTKQVLQGYGLANVHLESWTVAHSWTRGRARAKIVFPTEHPITIASAGWSPNTNGTIRGPVVYFDAKNKQEFSKFHGTLKNAIVIYQEPPILSLPKPEDLTNLLKEPMQPYWTATRDDTAGEFARAQMDFWKQEGVAAVIRDSHKPHDLLNMGDVSPVRFGTGEIPTAFAGGDGYRMIFRMLKHGPVQIEMEINDRISSEPTLAYNTVAEIRGSEKPEEMVIVGAHLDSWDLGTGSTDDGIGSVSVLEAARALEKLKIKPKRTIRFVLFSGEEQGLYGSKEYVKVHHNELRNISAVLVRDSGMGRVLKLGLNGNYQDRQIVDHVLEPLRDTGLLEPSMQRSQGTDHFPFDEAGVPGFFCIHAPEQYQMTHHSQSDTFDKVSKDDVDQGATLLAAWAFNTAELPDLMPRRPSGSSAAAEGNPAGAVAPDSLGETDLRIMNQAKADEPELRSNLTYLADNIGPRTTGSFNLDQASRWTAEQFRALGLQNVKLEAWTVPNSWQRGPATGRIIMPGSDARTEPTLTLASAGWSPSTNGWLRGPVIAMQFTKTEDLERYKGKLKGTIVLLGEPREIHALSNPLTSWHNNSIDFLPHANSTPHVDQQTYRQTRLAAMRMLADEKIGALLLVSDKEYGLLNMGSPVRREFYPADYPIAFTTREDYGRLWRLRAEKDFDIELDIGGSFSGKPVEVFNTIAEIRGAEKPDEVVIVAAHLDSWDLATGAADDGTGAMAVLEAARALKRSGIRPRRTIRFILFTGEEQGLYGSREYVKAHEHELDKISGVLIHDNGTGKVLTIGLTGNYGAREIMDHVLYPLAAATDVGLAEPTLGNDDGSDHVSFDQKGVPAFFCVQDPADYGKTHHSQTDTLDHIRWADLTEGAQVLAVFAYNVSQLPAMLPRKPSPHE
jgi:carboxypeptidase Q